MSSWNIERPPSSAVRENDTRGLSTVNRSAVAERSNVERANSGQFKSALDRAREGNAAFEKRADGRRDGQQLDARRAEQRNETRVKPNENENAQKQVEREKQRDKTAQTRQSEKKNLETAQAKVPRVGRDGKGKGDGFGSSQDQQQDDKKKQTGTNKELDPSRQPFNIAHMLLQPMAARTAAPSTSSAGRMAPAATPTETAALLERFVQSIRVGKVGQDGHEVHLKMRAGTKGSSVEVRLRKQGNMLLAILRADSDALPEAERLADHFRAQAKERGLDFDSIEVEMI